MKTKAWNSSRLNWWSMERPSSRSKGCSRITTERNCTMKKLMGIGLAVGLILLVAAGDLYARGGRGGGGGGGGGTGGPGMQGRSAFSQYGNGAQYGTGSQAAAMQQRMMQYRYGQSRQGYGMQSGMMQQQRLRDGSGMGQSAQGGQMGAGQGRGMQGRQGAGMSAGGGQSGRACSNVSRRILRDSDRSAPADIAVLKRIEENLPEKSTEAGVRLDAPASLCRQVKGLFRMKACGPGYAPFPMWTPTIGRGPRFGNNDDRIVGLNAIAGENAMKRSNRTDEHASIHRRHFLAAGAASVAGVAAMSVHGAESDPGEGPSVVRPPEGRRILLSCKLGMIAARSRREGVVARRTPADGRRGGLRRRRLR